MEATRRLEIHLPEELADAVRAQVESGRFANESEAVAAALTAMREQDEEQDPEIDAKLSAGYDAWKMNPAAVYTLQEVEQQLNERRAKFRR